MILQKINKYRDNWYLLKGLIFKLLIRNRQCQIGKNLKVSSFPKVTLLNKYKLTIGDNVVFGRNIDLRIYEKSELIIEDNCKIDDGVRIIAANKSTVHLKENTKIGFYSVLNGGGSINIGSHSSTYGFVYIQSSQHIQKRNKGFSKTDYNHSKIEIGNNVLIGPYCVLLPGSTIKNNNTLSSHQILMEKTSEA